MSKENNLTGKYILDEQGNPIEEPDVLKWGEWFETSNARRRVADTKSGSVRVSTVFMALDHSFGGEVPVLYESMVWVDGKDVEQERYETKLQALMGHQKLVAIWLPWWSIKRLQWLFKRI